MDPSQKSRDHCFLTMLGFGKQNKKNMPSPDFPPLYSKNRHVQTNVILATCLNRDVLKAYNSNSNCSRKQMPPNPFQSQAAPQDWWHQSLLAAEFPGS